MPLTELLPTPNPELSNNCGYNAAFPYKGGTIAGQEPGTFSALGLPLAFRVASKPKSSASHADVVPIEMRRKISQKTRNL